MPGIRIEPSAATSATAEPEISAKNSEAPIETCASPPLIQPNSEVANAIRRREIPDAFMIAPARMNSGIASSGKLVAPLYATIARFGRMSTPCVETSATMATMPSATAIGTLTSTSASPAANSSSIVMRARLRRTNVSTRSVQSLGERQTRGRRRFAPTNELDELDQLGNDDQRRRDRDHRLDEA